MRGAICCWATCVSSWATIALLLQLVDVAELGRQVHRAGLGERDRAHVGRAVADLWRTIDDGVADAHAGRLLDDVDDVAQEAVRERGPGAGRYRSSGAPDSSADVRHRRRRRRGVGRSCACATTARRSRRRPSTRSTCRPGRPARACGWVRPGTRPACIACHQLAACRRTEVDRLAMDRCRRGAAGMTGGSSCSTRRSVGSIDSSFTASSSSPDGARSGRSARWRCDAAIDRAPATLRPKRSPWNVSGADGCMVCAIGSSRAQSVRGIDAGRARRRPRQPACHERGGADGGPL